MSKLKFSTFWEWFTRYSQKITYDQQEILFENLFGAYYHRAGVTTPDKSRISEYKKGRPLPRELVNTYYPGTGHRKDLRDAVQECLMSNITTWPEAGEELYAIVANDFSICRNKREELMNIRAFDGDDTTTEWLTDVLICAIVPRILPGMPKSVGMVSTCYVPPPCEWFVGRTVELEMLDNLLSENKHVYLCGMPGIGKSELAKKYIRYTAQKQNAYQEVLWISCRKSLRSSIAGVEVAYDKPGDTEQLRFERHLHMIKHVSARGLIVLDNCNWLPEDEPLLDQIMECKCRVLVTTRTYIENRINLEVQEMEESDLLEMMNHFCEKRGYPERDLKQLIKRLYKHTFAVELAARLISKKIPTPRMLLAKLMWKRFARGIFNKAYSHQKDNITKKATFYEAISDLFALVQLGSDKQSLMRNMTLMPECGVYRDKLLMLLNLRDDEQVEDLERMGFLRWDDEEALVQMLPMVREIALEDLKPSIKTCMTLVDIVTEQCENYGADYSHWRLLYEIVAQIITEADIDDIEKYWNLLCSLFNYMEHVGDKTAMLQIFKAIEDIAERYSLSAHSRAEYLDMKAVLEENIDKKIEIEKQALNLLEEIGEGDCELARNIFSNLASTYSMAGDHKRSIRFLEERMEQLETEEETPLLYNYLTCVCNLAVTYANDGEIEKAIELLMPVEQQMRELRKNHSSEYGEVMEALGHVYVMAKQIPEAKDAYEKAYTIWMDLYGVHTALVQEKAREYKQYLLRAYLQEDIGRMALE